MAIIPSRTDIEQFRNPVLPEVMQVVERYEQWLLDDPSFGPADVFVSPYLANHDPALVLTTDRGVLVIEVLAGSLDDQNAAARIRRACERAMLFRAKFWELCFPPLVHRCLELDVESPDARAAQIVKRFIDAVVMVPKVSRQTAQQIAGRQSIPVYGDPDGPGTAPWPSAVRTNGLNDHQREPVLDTLWHVARSWLAPPFHRAEDGIIGQSQLTPSQRPHAVPRGTGWFRLQGPGGSGKSLVLAHKAAVLASQDKRVLLLCYNITLRSYLRDLVDRMRYAFDWRDITIRYFHELLKEVRLYYDAPITGDPDDKDTFLDRDYPDCVFQLLNTRPTHRFQYDAVLIDEGQDFSENWYRVLDACLVPNGELLLIRDRDQNIYGKDTRVLESGGPSIQTGKGLRGFSGPWATLRSTWRMSPQITQAVSEFAVRVLGSEPFDTDQGRQPTMFDAASFCRWENASQQDVTARLVEVIRIASQQMSPTHPSDLAVLTTTNKRAWEIVRLLEESGQPAVHVYDSDGHRDRDKLFHFCRGDGRIKVCTGHSFKGFEVWGVVVLSEPFWGE
ncbi:MAG: AAA family ATPase [Planctomycetota bacterium]|nr:MAG: AAA family ATPase [Planctomycetota bacterium]